MWPAAAGLVVVGVLRVPDGAKMFNREMIRAWTGSWICG